MCTASWIRDEQSYSVFFNRDEKRSRQRAKPPELQTLGGVRFIAATDGDAGGSWLAANEYGVTLGLLNGYQAENPPTPAAGFMTRGRLVTELSSRGRASAVRERIESADLSRFRSFVLIVWAPDGDGPVYRWSASGLRTEEAVDEAPLISSSFEPVAVRRSRIDLYRATQQGGPGGNGSVRTRETFHRSHSPSRGALSPCMHRPDARTVSYSRIRVDAHRCAYDYADGSPCAEACTTSVVLPRRDAPGAASET